MEDKRKHRILNSAIWPLDGTVSVKPIHTANKFKGLCVPNDDLNNVYVKGYTRGCFFSKELWRLQVCECIFANIPKIKPELQ